MEIRKSTNYNNWLHTEYTIKKRSTSDIAKELGCGVTTINRDLVTYNIQKRKPNKSMEDDVPEKEYFIQEHYVKGLSLDEISSNLNKAVTTVRRWMKYRDVKINATSKGGGKVADDIESKLTKENLYLLYIIDNKSVYDIANEVGCGATTVQRRLKEYGIEKKSGYLSSKERLYEEYVTKGRTSTDIAYEVGCTPSNVLQWIKKHGIETREYRDYFIGDALDNKDLLEKLYINERKSFETISIEYNCTPKTVENYIKKHGIRSRSLSESLLKDDEVLVNLLDKELLIKLYVEEGKTLDEVGSILGCSNTTVKEYLQKHGIEIRNVSQARLGDEVYKGLQGIDDIIKLYVDENKTLEDIGDMYGCSQSVIKGRLVVSGVEIRNNSMAQLKNKELYDKLHDKEWIKEEYVNKKKSAKLISIENGCTDGLIGRKLREFNVPIINSPSSPSVQEREIVGFIQSFGCDCEISDRITLYGKEIDILIINKNIGIEVNGLWWHSFEKKKDKNYHKLKTDLCEQQGIQLIHIFEDDWKYRNQQVKNLLLSKIGLIKEKVFARKCQVINGKFPEFFENNHIQGDVANTVTYGLQHEGTLVAAMAFKIRSEGVYELVRYATSIQVVGGASKLLKAFIRDFPECKEIISFADRCISNGNMYYQLGFTMEKIIRPDYKYIVGDRRVHKFNYRIDRFKKDANLLYKEGLTERQLADLNGLYRIYDAGKMRFVMKL